MIIRKGMNQEGVSKQIGNMSKIKRGFNQVPGEITNNLHLNNLDAKTKQSNVEEGKDLYKKINSLKNGPKIDK